MKGAPSLSHIRKQVASYKAVASRYEDLAVTLEDILRWACEQHAPLAIVQSRAKTIPSFAEKISRKWGSLKTDDPATEFTDLCGARVITLTRPQEEAICRFIEDHFTIDWDNCVNAIERLRPNEFGYLSKHYIVSLKPGVFTRTNMPVKVPRSLYPTATCPMKAEIQVRTILEHAFADVTHDLSYKSSFDVPEKWQRQIAAVAAALETTANEMEDIIEGLEYYAANYGRALPPEQTRGEIKTLELVLKVDRGNAELADRIARLAITVEDWDKAIRTLKRFLRRQHPAVWRDYGTAMVKKNRRTPGCPDYRTGCEFLEKAAQPEYGDSSAMAAYASSLRPLGDPDAVREWYMRAYQTDPTNSYALANVLEIELTRQKDPAPALLMRPAIKQATKRCLDQAEVGMNMPWAYYNAALFSLLLERPYKSLMNLAKAIQCSHARFMLESACRSTERLTRAGLAVEGLDWSEMLIAAASVAKHRTQAWATKPQKQASCGTLAPSRNNPFKAPSGPVVILAGSSDPKAPLAGQQADLLRQAFAGYNGTLVSGGTSTGVGGLAAEIAAANAGTVAVGYLPGTKTGVKPDPRYARKVRTKGSDFSPLEPLQYWHDLLAAGVDPASVRLIGIGGGRIAATEYRIALAMGAKVILLPGSGRAVEELLLDPHWRDCPGLITLPEEMWTLRYLIMPPPPQLPKTMREEIAEAIHEGYRKEQQLSADPADRAMQPWAKLDADLQESNCGQADDIGEKLAQIKCRMVKVAGRTPATATFSAEEIGTMAQMEHGRWNAQKLLAGWRHGSVKDTDRRTNPCLLPWEELPDNEKQKDIQTVSRIPQYLAALSYEVQRV